MPINLQGSGPITEGWGPAPHLEAQPLGNLVGEILKNRMRQQLLAQKNISDAVKNVMAYRQRGAYTDALRNAGLTQGQDISGLSEDQATELARRIEAQTPDTEMDAYHKAAAAKEQAMADWISQGKPPGTATGVDLSEHALGDIWTDPGTGITMRQTTRGPQPVAAAIQPTAVRPPSEADTYRIENQLMQQKTLHEALSAAEAEKNAAAHRDVKASNIPYSHADDYNAIVKRLEELRAMRQTPAAPSSITPGPAAPQTVVPEEPNKPVTPGEKIDPATAQQYLIKAQGNRTVAQQLAQRAGWTW